MTDTPTHLLIPNTTFTTMGEAHQLTNQLEHALAHHNTPANTHSKLTELFSEMVNNAAEHSLAQAYAFVRYIPSTKQFHAIISDRGIGIKQSLNNSHPTNSHTEALQLATQEGITSSGNPHRGIGLFSLFSELTRPMHKLTLTSYTGQLHYPPYHSHLFHDIPDYAAHTGTRIDMYIPT